MTYIQWVPHYLIVVSQGSQVDTLITESISMTSKWQAPYGIELMAT